MSTVEFAGDDAIEQKPDVDKDTSPKRPTEHRAIGPFGLRSRGVKYRRAIRAGVRFLRIDRIQAGFGFSFRPARHPLDRLRTILDAVTNCCAPLEGVTSRESHHLPHSLGWVEKNLLGQ